MDRLNRVAVATDFSDASRHAIEHAAVIAARNDAELVVLHVRVPLHQDGSEDGQGFPEYEAYQAALNKLAEKAVNDIKPKFSVNVRREIISGFNESDAIAEYVNDEIDLLVLGTHGRSGFAHALFGSVAEDTVGKARVPTLVVGQGPGHEPRHESYARILVPVDFSEVSRNALLQAVEIAHQHQAELLVVHVVEPVPNPALYVFGKDSMLDVFPELLEQSRRALDQLTQKVVGDRAVFDVTVAEGRPDEVIDRVARERDADLIVMGTSGHGLVDKFLLGSVTERVLRGSPCPVLAIQGKRVPNV